MRSTHWKDEAQRGGLEKLMRETLRDILGLDEGNTSSMHSETLLFGALPELDSMAVATLLTEIEDRFDIVIDDDEVDADLFETFGSLTSFVAGKLGHC